MNKEQKKSKNLYFSLEQSRYFRVEITQGEQIVIRSLSERDVDGCEGVLIDLQIHDTVSIDKMTFATYFPSNEKS